MISDIKNFARHIQNHPADVMEFFGGPLKPSDALLLEQTQSVLEGEANLWLDQALNTGLVEMFSSAEDRKMILSNLEARRYIRRLLSGWVHVSLN